MTYHAHNRRASRRQSNGLANVEVLCGPRPNRTREARNVKGTQMAFDYEGYPWAKEKSIAELKASLRAIVGSCGAHSPRADILREAIAARTADALDDNTRNAALSRRAAARIGGR